MTRTRLSSTSAAQSQSLHLLPIRLVRQVWAFKSDPAILLAKKVKGTFFEIVKVIALDFLSHLSYSSHSPPNQVGETSFGV